MMVARSSVASIVTRSSLARDRASGVRFATTEPVRFGSFFDFSAAHRVRSRSTERANGSIEEGFKTRIVDQFFTLGFARATDRFDPIRSDRTRSIVRVPGSLRASSNRTARGFRLIEVNKNLRARRDAVPSARSVVVDVDVRASERSRSRERFDSVRPVPSRVNRRRVGAGASFRSFDPRGRPRARRFVPFVRSVRFARRSFARRVTHPIRRSVDPS